jgi:bifunctional non-homologous end joining protein LigD
MIDVFPGWQGTAFYEAIVQFGLEGVVGKRLASWYKPGERSPDWLKIAVRQREEFVVGGFITNDDGRLAGIMVGRWNGNRKLVYEGTVGTGFSAADRETLLNRVALLRQKRCPFESVPVIRNRFSDHTRGVQPQWARPMLVVEIEFRQRTIEGLRHSSYRGLRVDSSAQTSAVGRRFE